MAARLDKLRADVQAGIVAYEALDLSRQEQNAFKAFKDTWNQYIQETRSYNELLKKKVMRQPPIR